MDACAYKSTDVSYILRYVKLKVPKFQVIRIIANAVIISNKPTHYAGDM